MIVGPKAKKMAGKGGKDEKSKYILMKIKNKNESNNAWSSVSNFSSRSEKAGQKSKPLSGVSLKYRQTIVFKSGTNSF